MEAAQFTALSQTLDAKAAHSDGAVESSDRQRPHGGGAERTKAEHNN
jgi:hypothetical protein